MDYLSKTPDDDKGPVIVAFLGTQALGDYLGYHLVAGSIARALPNSRLAIIYRDDRPYKSFINRLNPYMETALSLPGNSDDPMPLDWFDGKENVAGRPFGSSWYENGFHRPDLFLTASSLGPNVAASVGPPPIFRIPDDSVAPLAQALKSSGVDENRWFACLHMRENLYHWRRAISPERNVDPLTYMPMIEHIIHEQGGQVVRVGDPTMTPLPPMDGLIDLSADPESFPVEVFAASRARYYIGSESGPVGFACAFKVPAAMTNCMSIGLWNDGDVVLTRRNIRVPGKFELTGPQAAEIHDGMASWFVDAEMDANTPAELIAVAAHMHGATADCEGWRGDPPLDTVAPAGSVTFPLARRNRTADYNFVWM